MEMVRGLNVHSSKNTQKNAYVYAAVYVMEPPPFIVCEGG